METIAKMMTDFLVSKKCIKEEERAVCQYGYEILLSTIVGYTVVMLLSMLTGNPKKGIVFLAVFVITRMYTGGYHANTYLTCNLCLAFTYLIYEGMVYILEESQGTIIFLLLMLVVYCVCTIWFAPIENVHKRLTEEKKRKSRKVSHSLMVLWSVLGTVLVLKHNEVGIMIIVTLFLVAGLMIKEVYGRETVGKELQ